MECETNDCRKEKRGCKGCYYGIDYGEGQDVQVETKIEIKSADNSMEMVEEIKVGEYVRTECGIAKIEEIEVKREVYELDKEIMFIHTENWQSSCTRSQIIKHSTNPKELIEEEDILEYRINKLNGEKIGKVKKYKDARSFEEYLGIEGFKLDQIEILSILTKEQFESKKYEV